MPSTLRISFSDPDVEVPDISDKLENDQWLRADGECLCVCGYWYKRHLNVKDHDWLTVLCDNTLVKL